MTKHKQQSIDIIRGFEHNVSHFNELEQKLIMKVAKELEKNSYPLHQLTRVDLKKRISDIKDYYSYNEVIFLINPAIYKEGFSNSISENIGVGWEHPSTERHSDGSVEFEFGKSSKAEELIMNFYRLSDSYCNYALINNHDLILQKINEVLMTTDVKEIQFFTSKGIEKLIKNYHILITTDNENNMLCEMTINRIDYKSIDFEHFHKLHENYSLKINLETANIEILNCYDPTFFPTPAPQILPSDLKKGNL